jgi:hypothetical protein
MANVVVVDSNPILRKSLATQVQIAVKTATLIDSDDPTSALAVVRSTPVDVILIDAGLDAGIDAATVLLAVAARHPRASVLMRTTNPEDASPPRGGIAWVCSTSEDVSPLVGAISDAVTNRAAANWALADMDLVDMTGCLHKTRWSGALAVRDGRRSGLLVLHSGSIIHAEYDGQAGDGAAEAILRSPGGTICECDPPQTSRRTVVSETSDLLEGAAHHLANHRPEDALEITEDDLVEFMGLEDEEEGGTAGFQLFSDEEIAELALDDAMAIPIPKVKR